MATLLLTGFPSAFLARKVLLKVLDAEPETQIVCLCPRTQAEEVEAELAKLSPADLTRVEIAHGDTSDMDFGMSGRRFLDLAKRVDVVHHCAFATYAGVRRETAERINVGDGRGARTVRGEHTRLPARALVHGQRQRQAARARRRGRTD